MPKALIRSLIAAALLAAAFPLLAQQYPSRPIRFIAPFPPGGGVDIVARAVGEKLSLRLGQPVVVENKPGAGTRSGSGTIVFVVPAASRATSVKDFVALAKASPGRYTFASSGVGALIHLTGEMFQQAAAIQLTHVPYKGTTQILPDLLDGRVDMALDSLPAYIPHLKSGKLRALAVASRERSSLMPELPTMAEAGFPGVVSQTDYALYAPAATPRDIVVLLNRETNAVLQLADLRAKLAAQGIEVTGGTSESLQAELAEEVAKWGRVISQANIKPE